MVLMEVSMVILMVIKMLILLTVILVLWMIPPTGTALRILDKQRIVTIFLQRTIAIAVDEEPCFMMPKKFTP